MSTVRSIYSGFVGLDGVPVMLHDGDEYEASHPLVESHPEMFTEPRRAARTTTTGRKSPPAGADG